MMSMVTECSKHPDCNDNAIKDTNVEDILWRNTIPNIVKQNNVAVQHLVHPHYDAEQAEHIFQKCLQQISVIIAVNNEEKASCCSDNDDDDDDDDIGGVEYDFDLYSHNLSHGLSCQPQAVMPPSNNDERKRRQQRLVLCDVDTANSGDFEYYDKAFVLTLDSRYHSATTSIDDVLDTIQWITAVVMYNLAVAFHKKGVWHHQLNRMAALSHSLDTSNRLSMRMMQLSMQVLAPMVCPMLSNTTEMQSISVETHFLPPGFYTLLLATNNNLGYLHSINFDWDDIRSSLTISHWLLSHQDLFCPSNPRDCHARYEPNASTHSRFISRDEADVSDIHVGRFITSSTNNEVDRDFFVGSFIFQRCSSDHAEMLSSSSSSSSMPNFSRSSSIWYNSSNRATHTRPASAA
jgi:hypothetical protein